MKEEIEKLLGERDGLMLGICNGFQALIKLGLLPEGEIKEQGPESPTLAMNTIGRHVSKMVYTKVVSDKSPWLAGAGLGSVYCNPASHGEGRFVANESCFTGSLPMDRWQPSMWTTRQMHHGRVLESQWLLYGHRGHHQPRWKDSGQNGPFRAPWRGSCHEYLRRAGYEDI